MSDLRALIERVEKLDGPSREVDMVIHAMAEGRTVRESIHPQFGRQLLARNSRPPHDECWLNHPTSVYPAYTASLDAAIALCERVLPGEGFVLETTYGGNRAGIGKTGRYPSPGATPAIALVLATLRALEAQEGEG